MKILVVAGCCLQENSSANIAHCAYIQGMLDNGHEVSLVSGSNKGHVTDSNIDELKVKNKYFYNTLSLYDQLSIRKKTVKNNDKNVLSCTLNQKNHKKNKLKIYKEKIRGLYGIHGPIIMWYHRAKKYKSEQEFDYVVSLSYPFVSHLLVNYLKEKEHIKFKKWIQIWEDPWSTDLVKEDEKNVKNEELKLLRMADEILYVSPLTLEYQQKIFPSEKNKMKWLPLPTYFKEQKTKKIDKIVYGYFGDYNSNVRNLEPFYIAVKENRADAYICGGSDKKFESIDNVKVYPRMSLSELHEFEDKSSIIVVLCNLYGGQIPGKIYQYASSNKIILLILDGTKEEKEKIKKYFSQFNRYIFCENTIDDINEKINYIKEHFNELSNLVCPIDSFYPENIIKKLLVE